jgi:PHD/YefM family antitoxin component YafN of YafNO toxin-antitoxin module
MFLQEFSSTKFQRSAVSVFMAAQKKPIIITRQGMDGMIMMSKAEYSRLVQAAEKSK